MNQFVILTIDGERIEGTTSLDYETFYDKFIAPNEEYVDMMQFSNETALTQTV